jgi:dihydrofolate reductase
VDTLLLGKTTYEMFAAFWPSRPHQPDAQKVEWNNSRILRNVANDVAALQKSDGGNILVYGSAPLVKALLHHDLIDELRLMAHPLSIGGGLRLFDDNRELKKFGLKHSRAINDGVLILEYQPIS